MLTDGTTPPDRRLAHVRITGELFRSLLCERPPGVWVRCDGLPANSRFVRLDYDLHRDTYHAMFESSAGRLHHEGDSVYRVDVMVSSLTFPPGVDAAAVVGREWEAFYAKNGQPEG